MKLRTTGRLALAAFALASVVAGGAHADELQRDEVSGLHYLEVLTAGALATDKLPIIVALHGLGDHPETFRLLLDDLPAKARLIVPRAPMPHGTDGFSWFDFRAGDDTDSELEGIRVSGERVAKLIEMLQKKYGGPERAVVCGFSQGAILSFQLAAAHPDIIAAAIPVSGYLPPALWPAERTKVRPLPRVIALHGEKDQLVTLESARWSTEALRSNGYDTTLRSWPGVGHAFSPEMRTVLIATVVSAVEELAPKGSVLQGPPVPQAYDESLAPACVAPAEPPAAAP